MSVTIQQIADKIGVSRGTVDRALHNRPGVNPDIAAKIKKVAEELGYKPNIAGKLLSDNKFGKKLIGIIIVNDNNPFFDRIITGAKAAIDEFGDFGITGKIKVITKHDPDEQLNAIEELVSAGAVGIVMVPIFSPVIENRVIKLKTAGIPVVTINSDINGDDRLAYVGCHHKKSGRVMAELLYMLSDGKEKRVAVIKGSSKNLATTRREKGFFDFLNSSAKNINVVCTRSNEDNAQVSENVTGEIMKEYPNLDYICVLAGGIGGSIKAVRESESENPPKLLVYDLIDDVKTALKDQTVKATVTQEPFKQGYLGVQTMAKYIAFGQKPETNQIYTKLSVVLPTCLD